MTDPTESIPPSVLGRVTGDLLAPRGPDALLAIQVPASCFEEGARLLLRRPAKATCILCRGGGCDVCARAGGFRLPSSPDQSEFLEFVLPRQIRSEGVMVRIPHEGAPSSLPDEPRGHLIVKVDVGDRLSPGVSRDLSTAPLSRRLAGDGMQMRLVWMAILLCLLFVGLLRLSGWL
jgi:hypothetical protein